MCQVSKLSKANKHRYHRIPSLYLKYSLPLVWDAYLKKNWVRLLQGVKLGISKTLKFLVRRSFAQKIIIIRSSASCNKYRADFLQVAPWADFLSPIRSQCITQLSQCRWSPLRISHTGSGLCDEGKGKKTNKTKLAHSRRQQL